MFFDNKLPMTENKNQMLKKTLTKNTNSTTNTHFAMMIIDDNATHHHFDGQWRLNHFKSKNLSPFKQSKRL